MRPLSALAKAVLSGATVPVRWIARGMLPSGTYAGCDGPDDQVWDNGSGPLTYRGFGQALQVTLAPSQGARQKTGATLTLSGTDPAVMASLFAENYRNAPADLALLIIDPSTGLPAEELLMARGVFDVGTLSDSPAKPTDPATPQVSTLALTISPQTVDLDRPGVRQGTDVDQRLYRDEIDGFFKDVALAGTSQINWGIAGTASPVGAAPGGVALTGLRMLDVQY